MPVKGYPGEQVPTVITPEDREGTWLKINFQIDPYSLQSETPQSKLQAIMELMQNILMPAGPMMAQQKLGLNFAGLIQLFSRYRNITDMPDILIAQEPLGAMDELQDIPQMPSMQPATRTVNRVSRSEATGPGQDMAMQMAMMGAASPQQEAMVGGMGG